MTAGKGIKELSVFGFVYKTEKWKRLIDKLEIEEGGEGSKENKRDEMINAEVEKGGGEEFKENERD